MHPPRSLQAPRRIINNSDLCTEVKTGYIRRAPLHPLMHEMNKERHLEGRETCNQQQGGDDGSRETAGTAVRGCSRGRRR